MAMRWTATVLILLAVAGCDRASSAPKPPPAAATPQRLTLRPQPKPGERVRQSELDSYCAEPQRPAAFYYHGGSPVVTVARKDGCAPLYMTECENEARCYPQRDQEPGMWCCADRDNSRAQHAQR
jgi:hypothetical protein